MTNPNKAELRRLTEAATPGQWVTDGEEIGGGGKIVAIYVAHEDGGRIGQVFANCLVPTDAKCRANAAFMAAANPTAVLSLLDECDSMERFQTAYMEWQEKTDWVRWDIKPKELGMHVADVMTARIIKAEAERDAALAELEARRIQVGTLTEWYSNALDVIREVSAAIPGVTYMDPPDGGDVSIPEQIRRMAKDAELYRWVSSGAQEAETLVSVVLCHGGDAAKIAERIATYMEANQEVCHD